MSTEPIRPAAAGDAPAVHQLVQRAYAHYVERMGFQPGPMREDYTAKVAEGGVWVVEDGGEVVGLIVLVEEPDHLLIENVAVEPSRQGEGIGRALLAFAESSARRARLPGLRLYTHSTMTENQELYRRLGYEETEQGRFDEFDRVFFVKRLGP